MKSLLAIRHAPTALLVCCALTAEASGQLPIRGLALDGSDQPLAALHAHGVQVYDGTAWTFSCVEAKAPPEGRWLLHTGKQRLIVVGERGVAFSDNLGCAWRAMQGDAGLAEVVGVHQPELDGARVLFAVHSAAKSLQLGLTTDGGQTSTLLDQLAIAGTRLDGMVGSGQRLLVIGVADVPPKRRFWRSDDGAESFVEGELAGVDPEVQIAPAALSADGQRGWLWIGDEVARLDCDSGQVSVIERAFPGAAPDAAIDVGGSLLIAAGEAGLVSVDEDGAVTTRLQQPAAAVIVRDDRIWVGRGAARVGDTVALVSDDGTTWHAAGQPLQAQVAYPASCDSLGEQLCGDAAVGLLSALGAGSPSPDGASAETSEPASNDCAGAGGGGPTTLLLLLGLAVGRRRRFRRGP